LRPPSMLLSLRLTSCEARASACLILLLLGGCDAKIDTRSPAERFGLIETPAGRPITSKAIPAANAVLGSHLTYRLRASWQVHHDEQQDVPVYLIDGSAISAAYVVMVPTGCRCVFVQPVAFREWLDDHTKGLPQMTDVDPEAILAFMLL